MISFICFLSYVQVSSNLDHRYLAGPSLSALQLCTIRSTSVTGDYSNIVIVIVWKRKDLKLTLRSFQFILKITFTEKNIS